MSSTNMVFKRGITHNGGGKLWLARLKPNLQSLRQSTKVPVLYSTRRMCILQAQAHAYLLLTAHILAHI